MTKDTQLTIGAKQITNQNNQSRNIKPRFNLHTTAVTPRDTIWMKKKQKKTPPIIPRIINTPSRSPKSSKIEKTKNQEQRKLSTDQKFHPAKQANNRYAYK